MLTTTLRSLWSHKLRLVATCIAVVLGVAFMAATLVLNSTLTRVFEDLFSDLGEGIDAVVRGPELFETDFGDPVRDLLPDTVVDKVRQVPGVAAAEGSVFGYDLTLLDAKGVAVVPGSAFGEPRSLRISYSCPTPQQAPGMQRFKEFFAELA